MNCLLSDCNAVCNAIGLGAGECKEDVCRCSQSVGDSYPWEGGDSDADTDSDTETGTDADSGADTDTDTEAGNYSDFGLSPHTSESVDP